MIKKPEDNIDASHRLSIDNFIIITKFKVRNGYGRHSPRVLGGGEINNNEHNLPQHCTSTESYPGHNEPFCKHIFKECQILQSPRQYVYK